MAAIRLKTTVKLRAEADCPSHARADLAIRDVVFTIDEPVERGGTNAGPSPTEAALAALVGCTNVIGHKCAEALGIDIGHLRISAVCDFDRRGVTLSEEIERPFERIVLDVVADGVATDEELARVAADVSKFCALSKLFRAAGTEITETWRRREA